MIQQSHLWSTRLTELKSVSQRHLHTHVHGSIIPNSQDMEIACLSTNE